MLIADDTTTFVTVEDPVEAAEILKKKKISDAFTTELIAIDGWSHSALQKLSACLYPFIKHLDHPLWFLTTVN